MGTLIRMILGSTSPSRVQYRRDGGRRSQGAAREVLSMRSSQGLCG